MNLAEIRAELEDELTWRLDDLKFFRNQLSHLPKNDQDRYCRSLVVMLYSHFEGFWRAAFSIYVKALNDTGIACGDACDAVMAANLYDALHALSDSQKKSEFFRAAAPNDVKLHLTARQMEFIGRLREAAAMPVNIPVERVVDAESNLTPVVIRKNLFRLGFPHDMFAKQEGTVHQLLERRNDVAHGSARKGVPETKYIELETAVIRVMDEVLRLVYDALKSRRYLKTA